MGDPVLRVIAAGLALTVQDAGRPGWRRFGVPLGGTMDEHAASWANRLVGNPPDTPVLELALQGARFAALRDVWIAVTGANASASVAPWHSILLRPGDEVSLPRNVSGVWTYLALDGGVESTRVLGSASSYVRGGFGRLLAAGDLISRATAGNFRLPPGVAGQMTPALERRNYDCPPPLRVWAGPQFAQFSEADRTRFFQQSWAVSSRSDRVGYRLEGAPLTSRPPALLSEPVRLGSIQVPEGGTPIVTMRDGPTVGGYAKLGVVDARDLSWLAQCKPGQAVRFQLS